MSKKTTRGARGKYQEWRTPEGLTKLEGWTRNGLTDEQVAHNIGIRTSTLYEWKKRYPDISEALKKGKEVVDLQMENELMRRGLGYHYDEIEWAPVEKFDEETGETTYELVEVKRKRKHVPGDVTAQIFWLKNRKPEAWRDKQDIEHTGTMTSTLNMTGLTEQELRNLANLDAGTDE